MKLNSDNVIKTFSNNRPRPISKHSYYSVLVPFVEKEGKLYILYEMRALKMSTQPGEICFPGGRIERGEGPIKAALRETSEELGIDVNKIEFVGRGDILYGYANYTIYTNIGLIKYEDYMELSPSKDEVEEVFLISVEDLIENPPNQNVLDVKAIMTDFPFEKIGVDENYPFRYGKWSIPIYEVDGRAIWGLTARITEHCIYKMLKDD